MKTFRLAFLLGILSTSLIGCGGGNSTCKVTFKGTNCFIRNGLDDKAKEFDTLDVPKNSSQTFQIFVKETDKFLVPEGSKVDTGDIKRYYYQSTDTAGHKEGQLVLENISHDVTITATAREKTEVTYSVTYMNDSDCKWANDNPTSIKANETLVAKITSDEPATKDGFYVYVKGTGEIAKNKYTYENKTLTLDGSCVTGDVTLYAFVPKPEEYTVEFTMENATASFPAKQTQGVPLIGYIYADKGYRVPTKDELSPVGHETDYGTIIKYKQGVRHPLTQNQFYYESYIDSKTGISTGYLIITDVLELWDAEKIEVGGTPIQQVTVTFTLPDGDDVHWNNAGKTKEDRYGTIDKGDKFGNAEKAASGTEQPVKDGEQWSFDCWKDESGASYYSSTKIENDVKVCATFKQKEYTIYKEDVHYATITGLPTEPIHWHDPIGSATNPIKITADSGHKLPDKNLVEVTMKKATETTWHDIDFNYTKTSDTEADFYINEGIVEGDIKIALSAIQYVSVTFDPKDGTWPNTKKTGPQTANVPVNTTFEDALASLDTGGNPTLIGKTWGGWKDENETVVDMTEEITADIDGATLYATFNETVNFSNDTWANVIAHANNGTLIDTYGATLQIGATRRLDYTDPVSKTNKELTVRVIDTEYDYYWKDGKKIPSALTFEFVDLVGEGAYGVEGSYGSNNWENSDYRSWLNNFYAEIVSQNEGFVAKKAIKYTLQGHGSTPKSKIATEDYFFPLSGAEINIAESNGLEYNPTTYRNEQRVNEAVSDRGLPYYYYLIGSPSRLKKLSGTNSEYWLRSPHVYKEETQQYPEEPDETNCYLMGKTSGTATDFIGWQYNANASNSHGYMAAFCI